MNTTNILKGFRVKKGLTQEDVANQLGISRQRYNTIENDIIHSDCILVFRILDILKLDSRELTDFLDAFKQDYKSYPREA